MTGEVDWRSAYAYLEKQYEQTLRLVEARWRADLERGQLPVMEGVEVQRIDVQRLRAIAIGRSADPEYAFYVYRGDELLQRVAYTRSNTVTLDLPQAGEYRVRGFVRVRNGDGVPASRTSEPVDVPGEATA